MVQVAAERAALEEARTQRAAERERFLSECMDEKRALAAERADLGKTREALVNEEVKVMSTVSLMGFRQGVRTDVR